MKYAEGTSVSVQQSQNEIRNLLARHGVKQFAYAEEPERAAMQFVVHGLPYRMTVERPTARDVAVRGARSSTEQRIDKEWKRRWRARLLWLKATLEFAADEGPEAIAQALLAHLVLPGGQTMGSWSERQLPAAYQSGQMPPLLLEGG